MYVTIVNTTLLESIEVKVKVWHCDDFKISDMEVISVHGSTEDYMVNIALEILEMLDTIGDEQFEHDIEEQLKGIHSGV